MSTPHTGTNRRELDHRRTTGVEVTLSWAPDTNLLFVTVLNDADDSFELVVEAHKALDAFHHPYAYTTFRGLELLQVTA